jgi:hypothetical protein
MNIDKAQTGALQLPCLVDAETAAALALNEDAKQSRQLVREIRKEEQQQRLELMRQAASKLREMASKAIGSAVWQGVAGLASAACSMAGAFKGGQAEKIWKSAAGFAGAQAQIDPFAIQSKLLEADRAELDARAEAAGNRASEAGDLESEARRLQDSAGQLMQKANDARHAAMMAALRG